MELGDFFSFLLFEMMSQVHSDQRQRPYSFRPRGEKNASLMGNDSLGKEASLVIESLAKAKKVKTAKVKTANPPVPSTESTESTPVVKEKLPIDWDNFTLSDDEEDSAVIDSVEPASVMKPRKKVVGKYKMPLVPIHVPFWDLTKYKSDRLDWSKLAKTATDKIPYAIKYLIDRNSFSDHNGHYMKGGECDPETVADFNGAASDVMKHFRLASIRYGSCKVILGDFLQNRIYGAQQSPTELYWDLYKSSVMCCTFTDLPRSKPHSDNTSLGYNLLGEGNYTNQNCRLLADDVTFDAIQAAGSALTAFLFKVVDILELIDLIFIRFGNKGLEKSLLLLKDIQFSLGYALVEILDAMQDMTAFQCGPDHCDAVYNTMGLFEVLVSPSDRFELVFRR